MKLLFKKSFMFLPALALVISALGVTPAYATSTALHLANVLFEDPTLITGASYTTIADPAETAAFNTALSGFPKGAGPSYAVMSTGDTAEVPNTGTFVSTSYAGGNIRGDSDYDVVIVKIDMDIPAGRNCLSFDLRFLSEEYPIYVGTGYNDAFVAELDTSDWTTNSGVITAPNNFATVAGAEVSVNSLPMTAANGAGTAFDGGGSEGGASVLVTAQTSITPGPHSLYLSIFDQGDNILDSAVLMDNLIVFNSTTCTEGAFFIRVLNPGFNTYVPASSKIPVNWTAKNFIAADGKDLTIKKDGTASVRFTGTGASKTLTQSILTSGAAGDELTFSYWAKGISIPTAGKCMGQVMLYSGTTLVNTKTLNCASGTYGFTKKTLTYTTPGAYDRVVIRFTSNKASGRVWFDAVTLVR